MKVKGIIVCVHQTDEEWKNLNTREKKQSVTGGKRRIQKE